MAAAVLGLSKAAASNRYVRALKPEEEETYLQKPFTSQDLLRKVKQLLAPAAAT